MVVMAFAVPMVQMVFMVITTFMVTMVFGVNVVLVVLIVITTPANVLILYAMLYIINM